MELQQILPNRDSLKVPGNHRSERSQGTHLKLRDIADLVNIMLFLPQDVMLGVALDQGALFVSLS